MPEGAESVYGQMDIFSETEEANYVIIGPMAFVKELGFITGTQAIDEAREVKDEVEKKSGERVDIRLYMRTKDFGAVQIDIY